jgi:hypothetical protein
MKDDELAYSCPLLWHGCLRRKNEPPTKYDVSLSPLMAICASKHRSVVWQQGHYFPFTCAFVLPRVICEWLNALHIIASSDPKFTTTTASTCACFVVL